MAVKACKHACKLNCGNDKGKEDAGIGRGSRGSWHTASRLGRASGSSCSQVVSFARSSPYGEDANSDLRHGTSHQPPPGPLRLIARVTQGVRVSSLCTDPRRRSHPYRLGSCANNTNNRHRPSQAYESQTKWHNKASNRHRPNTAKGEQTLAPRPSSPSLAEPHNKSLQHGSNA